ncbi:Aspartate-semialdehyde dehydrogenase, partial [Haemophilus influenzae]
KICVNYFHKWVY